MLDETASKGMHTDGEGDGLRKKMVLNEVKPVENITKDLESFLEIIPWKRKPFLHTH